MRFPISGSCRVTTLNESPSEKEGKCTPIRPLEAGDKIPQ